MVTLRINRSTLAATLAPVVLAGGILAPVAGAKTTQPNEGHSAAAHVQSAKLTRGFDVRNYTSQPLKLERFDHKTGGDIDTPTVGTVMQPGESQHFEGTLQFLNFTAGTAWYVALGDDGKPTGKRFAVFVVVDPYGFTKVQEGWDRNDGTGTHWGDLSDGQTATFVDATATEVTIGGEQWQKQANILKSTCDNKDATCTFNPTGETHVVSEDRSLKQYAFTNPYDWTAPYSFTASDNVGESNSLEITASEKFGLPKWLASAEVTLSQKYGHTWNESHTFSFTFQVPVPPRCTITPTHKAPMVKDTGDFTVKLGNTTWHLNNVSWLWPDDSDEAQDGGWSYVLTPVTPAELASAKADPPAGPIKRSAVADAPKCG